LQISCKINIYTIECTHHKYYCSQPCLILLASCILVACGNYITIKVNVKIQSVTILPLVYDLDTYDHLMWMHFHHPLHMTLSTCLKLDVNYDSHFNILSCVARLPIHKYYFFIVLQLVFNCFITNFPLHCNSERHVAL